MSDFVKKSLLAGAGLALVTAEKIKAFVEDMVQKGQLSEEEAKETLARLVETSRKTVEERAGKLLTDFSGFWYYDVWSDEIEERAEQAVADILRELHIPQREDLEDLKRRIEALEKQAAGTPEPPKG